MECSTAALLRIYFILHGKLEVLEVVSGTMQAAYTVHHHTFYRIYRGNYWTFLEIYNGIFLFLVQDKIKLDIAITIQIMLPIVIKVYK